MRGWVNALLVSVALLVAGLSVWVVLNLRDVSTVKTVSSEATSEPVRTESSPLETVTVPSSAEPVLNNAKATDVEPKPNELSALLAQLRKERNYSQDGVSRSEAEDSAVLLEMTQWFYTDPVAFIELSKEEDDDAYILAVLQQQITPSNVHLLADHLHIRHGHLVDLAYENQLHQQQPEPFLSLYEQFGSSRFINNSNTILQAVAEIDYWGYRDSFMTEAVSNAEPTRFFEVLDAQGQEDMFQLANQMWAAHERNDYKDLFENATSHIDRIRLGYQYGVSGAVAEIAALQRDGIRVDETIDAFTDVDNASERFQAIYPQLAFDFTTARWTLPE